MAENSSKSIFRYQIDPLIKPEANLSVWVWLTLLGIPALLLMLIYSKVEDRQHQQEMHQNPAAISAQPLQQH
ncbi:hypothetical protein [Vampirovibrio chlorellavorus]|uniref:hypothetical protein n=1 Tax=Vampirovibrio chlorellavorus TaxID=758823 RepID=UPI0026E9A693|nr:hypothetical protein [Vampirovibrio chlorellavorus]